MFRSTDHRIINGNSSTLSSLEDESVNLVVTSPPYPLIGMWDELFGKLNPSIAENLKDGNGKIAFQEMHDILDLAWSQCYRVLRNGGIACINIGDAIRTFDTHFSLYDSHSRISRYCTSIGFTPLPSIVWRKPGNSPNKFMGSGMLPPGAYVTLEHEHILIFRKGKLRKFTDDDQKKRRKESGYFWEERNNWFTDLWTDITGTRQKFSNSNSRNRTGAFPFEIPYRLVNMFSVYGDTVLDPFLGTGTTTVAGIASARNTIGIEISEDLRSVIDQNITGSGTYINEYIGNRKRKHDAFIKSLMERKKEVSYRNNKIGSPVITRQEVEIILPQNTEITKTCHGFSALHRFPG